jgi:Cys-Gly metallodipeptidase DUG1
MSDALDKVFSSVEKLSQTFIDNLAEAVAIPSISADPAHRQDVFAMGRWLSNKMTELGCVVESRKNPLGKQAGTEMDLPDILLGHYGADKNKKTVLVYGHYDVQPAQKEDGWAADPFVLTEDKQTGRLYGRGSTDDKGPVLGWLHAIQAFQDAGVDFPVNLKMCFEGMEEYGSEGLEELVQQEAKQYFGDCAVACISDNYWLGEAKPCLTYGLRGVQYFNIVVAGPETDLHSGVYGGTVHEPMTDLIAILGSLVAPNGKILIPGIYDQVSELTDDEKKLYENIDFSLEEFQKSLGHKVNLKDSISETLMARWRYPSLSLHGIEGAFSQAGAKTVIPGKVQGKFSIRTVPNMTSDEVSSLVKKHIEKVFAETKSKNRMSIEELHAGQWWYSSPHHPNFRAAAVATKRVYGVEPDFTREGGSIPITTVLSQIGNGNTNVCLLPMGSGLDNPHSAGESIPRRNYIEGTKLLGAYLYELSRTDLTESA